MRSRFVPPSYERDLQKKLQCLEQGNISVQEYYQELQKGIHCGIVEDTKDKIAHFYGVLKREIQDIVDYKEYNTTNSLLCWQKKNCRDADKGQAPAPSCQG